MPRAVADRDLVSKSLSGFWWGAGLLIMSIAILGFCSAMVPAA